MWRGGERGTWEWIDGWGWRGGIVFHPSPPAPHRSAPRSSLCLSRVSYLIHSSSALARFFLLCIFRFFFLCLLVSPFFYFLPLFLLSLLRSFAYLIQISSAPFMHLSFFSVFLLYLLSLLFSLLLSSIFSLYYSSYFTSAFFFLSF